MATYSTSDLRFYLAFAASDLRLPVATPPVLTIHALLECAGKETVHIVQVTGNRTPTASASASASEGIPERASSSH